MSRPVGISALVGTAVAVVVAGFPMQASAETQGAEAESQVQISGKKKPPKGKHAEADGLPKIGKIQVRKVSGKHVVSIPVAYDKAIGNKHVKKSPEEVTLGLLVYGKQHANGDRTKIVQRKADKFVLRQSHQRVHKFTLNKRAVKALRLGSKSPEKGLLHVFAIHSARNALHEHSFTKRSDHHKITEVSWAVNAAQSKKPKKKSDGVQTRGWFDTSTTPKAKVKLINNTPSPIHIYEQDIMCMSDGGHLDSNPAGFNAQQDASLRPGGVIEQNVLGYANSDVAAQFQGADESTIAKLISKDQKIAKLEKKFIDWLSGKLGFVGSILETAFYDSGRNCNKNVAAFQLGIVDEQGNATSQAWAVHDRSANQCRNYGWLDLFTTCDIPAMRGPLTTLEARASVTGNTALQVTLQRPNFFWMEANDHDNWSARPTQLLYQNYFKDSDVAKIWRQSSDSESQLGDNGLITHTYGQSDGTNVISIERPSPGRAKSNWFGGQGTTKYLCDRIVARNDVCYY